jgi:hypothetical protein
MSRPRGLNLSGTQVIASVLATLTGAIAASYLGVAGTLVGAALGSIASTMGTEIYKHYLQRSQERLLSAGQVLHHTGTGTAVSGTGAGAAVGGRHAASAGSASRQVAGGEAERETAVWDQRQYGVPRDPHETEMIPGVATEWGGGPNGGSPNGGNTNGGTTNGGSPYGRTANGRAANGGGRPGDTASYHAHGKLTDEGPAGDGAGSGSLWGAVTSFFSGLTRRQWLTYGGIAAGFFIIVVAGIIVFQLVVGRPLLSNSFGAHTSRQQQHTTHPSSTPSATPTGSTPASPTSSAPATSGTPTPSSGTPSPGTSGTASSPSTVPSPTPSTGSSGAARSTPTP